MLSTGDGFCSALGIGSLLQKLSPNMGPRISLPVLADVASIAEASSDFETGQTE